MAGLAEPAARAQRRAWLAGATGLIGSALLPLLVRSHASVEILARKSVAAWGEEPKLRVRIVDFARLPSGLPACDDAFVALGTTIKVAGSQALFRAVDHDAVVATARAARAAGATRLAVVSALGADVGSRVFYNRVKGEMEEAVGRLGFASVVLARPSILVGDRRTLGQAKRSGETLALALTKPLGRLVPASVRPIAASAVAAAMVATLDEGRPGVRIVDSREMQAFARA